IEATLPSESEPGFKTPGEAIEFSKSIDRARRPNGLDLCSVQIIRTTDWRDQHVPRLVIGWLPTTTSMENADERKNHRQECSRGVAPAFPAGECGNRRRFRARRDRR